MRAVLRRLPGRLSFLLQRRFYPGQMYMDGMGDAVRREAFSSLLPEGAGMGECPEYGPPFDPPWEVFPDYDWPSMGFRMGGGEDYIVQFGRWYGHATDAEVAAYKAEHPAPEGYETFFAAFDEMRG